MDHLKACGVEEDSNDENNLSKQTAISLAQLTEGSKILLKIIFKRN